MMNLGERGLDLGGCFYRETEEKEREKDTFMVGHLLQHG